MQEKAPLVGAFLFALPKVLNPVSPIGPNVLKDSVTNCYTARSLFRTQS